MKTLAIILLCFSLMACGNKFGSDTTNTMSGNTTQNPPGGANPTPGQYEIVIDTVAASSTTATPVNAYTVYFTDPVAVNTPFLDGYALQADGIMGLNTITAMSGKGVAEWTPHAPGSHMLAIWDGQGRHSAPYAIVTP